MEIVYAYLLLILTSTTLNYSVIKIKSLSKIYPGYSPLQKIHKGFVPPIGGLIIFFSTYSFNYLINESYLLFKWYVFLPSLSIIIIGLIEDFGGKASPFIRLLVIFIGSCIFCYNSSIPSLEIWLIGDLINQNKIIQVLFYSICLTGLSNGVNMIDGMNGLAGFTVLSMIFSIFTIIISLDVSKDHLTLIISLAISVTVFLFFNFPFGKIFLGDSGAYWLGWVIGIIVINIYSNNDLNTWGAVIILFYPSIEVIFSTFRKIFSYQSPFKADLNHLHLKLYFKIKGPVERSNIFNSFTTICLMPLWITPPLLIIWSQYNSSLNHLFLILLIILYLTYFNIVPSFKSEK